MYVRKSFRTKSDPLEKQLMIVVFKKSNISTRGGSPIRPWEYITFLRFRKYRVNCPKCGIKTEYLPFIADNHRITRSLAITTYELCKVMTVKAVSIFQADLGQLQKNKAVISST